MALYKSWGRVLVFLGLFLAMGLSTARAEVVERILAVVNDEVITQSEVDQMAKSMQGHPGVRLPADPKALRQELVNALIMQKLAKAEAKRRGITVSDKEVDQAFAEFKKRNHVDSDEVLAKALAKEGMTIKSLKQQIADQMTQERLVAIVAAGKAVITEAQVKAFYDKEFPKTTGGQVHLKILNLAFPPGATAAQQEEVKKKAEAILQDHRKGVPWDQLREKYSVMLQDMGFISESDLDPELAQFLGKVKTGDTAPIQTASGFQLVQIVARKDSKSRSFEEVAPQIRDLLQRQEMEKTFKEWMNSQKDRSLIKIMM